MENLGNDFSTTLAGAIANGTDTAITVASGTGSPSADFRIRVDDELMLVTSKGSGTDWTVTRGVEGTTAAAHSNGAGVFHVVTAGAISQYLADRYIDTASKDASGGVPGLTLFKLNLRNALNTITSWFTTAATVARTWTLPDKDGTVAMTSDITGGGLAGSFTTLGATGLVDISGASAGQIKFPATQNASSNANTLDDYEEGTWTIALTIGGSGTGITYSVQTGTYTKIGNRAICAGAMTLSSKGSSTGAVKISGFPFACGSSEPSTSATLYIAAWDVNPGDVGGILPAGTTLFAIDDMNVAEITNAYINNSSRFNVNIAYGV